MGKKTLGKIKEIKSKEIIAGRAKNSELENTQQKITKYNWCFAYFLIKIKVKISGNADQEKNCMCSPG